MELMTLLVYLLLSATYSHVTLPIPCNEATAIFCYMRFSSGKNINDCSFLNW